MVPFPVQALAVVLRAGLCTWRGEGGARMRTNASLGVRRLWAPLHAGDQLQWMLGSWKTNRQGILTYTNGMSPTSNTVMVHLLLAMCE